MMNLIINTNTVQAEDTATGEIFYGKLIVDEFFGVQFVADKEDDTDAA
jgi:hypothetical protein